MRLRQRRALGSIRRDRDIARCATTISPSASPIVVRERVYRRRCASIIIAASPIPIFVHGHYVVKSFNRFGRVVFVEVDPYTGAFMGEFRV